MCFDSVPQHYVSHGKIFWQWGKSDHCFKPILKSVCSNCHVWPKLLLAPRLSPQYSVDVRANKKQEKQTSKKNQNKTLVHGRFLFPLHHRDNVSCVYQPVYVCTCNIFHAVTSFSSLSSLLSQTFIWLPQRAQLSTVIEQHHCHLYSEYFSTPNNSAPNHCYWICRKWQFQ